MTIPTTSDENLQDTLVLLRGFALSFVIQAIIESGFLDLLEQEKNSDGLKTTQLYDAKVVDGLLAYLETENIIVATREGSYVLSELGRRLSRQRGWFQLFVGGYSGVLAQISAMLKSGVGADLRNFAQVARGSGEISAFDAAPLACRLIWESKLPCRRLLDIGCGDASLLCALVEKTGAESAIGVDPSQLAIDEAGHTVRSKGCGDRVELIAGDAFLLQAGERRVDFIVAAFVLQEILGQRGRDHLIRYLRTVSERWHHAQWIVIEVDHQPRSAALKTLHGLGYYNPYYLLHSLTHQQLLSRDEWQRLFAEAGLRVEAIRTTDPNIDSTGLELGFRLAFG